MTYYYWSPFLFSSSLFAFINTGIHWCWNVANSHLKAFSISHGDTIKKHSYMHPLAPEDFFHCGHDYWFASWTPSTWLTMTTISICQINLVDAKHDLEIVGLDRNGNGQSCNVHILCGRNIKVRSLLWLEQCVVQIDSEFEVAIKCILINHGWIYVFPYRMKSTSVHLYGESGKNSEWEQWESCAKLYGQAANM